MIYIDTNGHGHKWVPLFENTRQEIGSRKAAKCDRCGMIGYFTGSGSVCLDGGIHLPAALSCPSRKKDKKPVKMMRRKKPVKMMRRKK